MLELVAVQPEQVLEVPRFVDALTVSIAPLPVTVVAKALLRPEGFRRVARAVAARAESARVAAERRF